MDLGLAITVILLLLSIAGVCLLSIAALVVYAVARVVRRLLFHPIDYQCTRCGQYRRVAQRYGCRSGPCPMDLAP